MFLIKKSIKKGKRMKNKIIIVCMVLLYNNFLMGAFVGAKQHLENYPTPVFATINGVTITIVRGDILTLKKDYNIEVHAIVNAANSDVLRVKGGISGKIFRAAHQPGPGNSSALNNFISKYMVENQMPEIPLGTYIVTPSFALLKEGILHIIHAVGPDCRIPEQKEGFEKTLHDLYYSILNTDYIGFKSVAFPFISGEIFACPKKEAAQAELEAAIEYAHKGAKNVTEVYFVLYTLEDYELFVSVFKKLMHNIMQPGKLVVEKSSIEDYLSKLKNSLQQLHDQLTGLNIASLIW